MAKKAEKVVILPQRVLQDTLTFLYNLSKAAKGSCPFCGNNVVRKGSRHRLNCQLGVHILELEAIMKGDNDA